MRAPFGFAVNQPIEGRLPADDAVGQFLDEAAIGGRKRRSGELGLEQVLDIVLARFPPSQDLNGNFSWILPTHALIMILGQFGARFLDVL